jgi:GTP pyrophosphokinase
LRNGDMVEIMSSTNRKPSRDWLKMVVTSRAKSKIRHWINTEQKQEAIAVGRRLLEREVKRLRQSPRKVFEGEKMAQYLSNEGLGRIDDLFQRIGYGKIPLKQVLMALVDREPSPEPMIEKPGPLRRAMDRAFGTGPVLVKGHGDLMTTLAKCCNPVPGEEVVGYVTRGRGISVHSHDCPNVVNLTFDPDRIVEVDWARQSNTVFEVGLAIETEDYAGMLARLTEVIAKEHSNIRHFKAEAIDTGMGVIEVVVEIRNRRHLDRLRKAIAAVAGVREVRRCHRQQQSSRHLGGGS